MNRPEPTPDSTDRLARAEAAFRAAPVPEGPSEDLVARTRAALRDAEDRPDIIPAKTRRRPMITMLHPPCKTSGIPHRTAKAKKKLPMAMT